MSQRKLLGALSIILLAFLFILVGCGDGKRNSKTQPRKVLPHGKVGGSAGGGISGKAGTNGLSLKNAHITSIDDALRSQSNGDLVDIQSLDDGDYILDSTLGHVKFMRVSGDEVRAIVSARVIGMNLANQVSDKEGLIASDTDEGRELEIPASFSVKNKALDLGSVANLLYRSQLELTGGLKQELLAATGTGPSVIKSLNGSLNSANSYPLNINGIEAGIQIRKISNGVRIIVSLLEKKAGNTAKQGDSTFIRTLVFSYSLKGANKSEAAPVKETVPTKTAEAATQVTEAEPQFQMVEPSQNETPKN